MKADGLTAGAATIPAAAPLPLFGSMLMGGFECATQKMPDGRRLDVAAATGHDVRAAEDYRLLRSHGITSAREGLRWHRIETRPGRYDWSNVLPMLKAARDAGMTVVWDLLHFGVPDDVDVFSAALIDRFAAFARAAGEVIGNETITPPLFTPINEISFWAFAGGDAGGLHPFARGRGGELKQQLVRAALAAVAELRALDPCTLIATAEPLIHVLPASAAPKAVERARAHNEAQFEALDMLLGRRMPELGGHPAAVDIVGCNFYFNNQWIDGGRTVPLGDWQHRPLHALLGHVAARYDKPIYIAETGTEGVFRPLWLRYVADEVRTAAANGINVGGICLYPIISHLGWDDDRRCVNGMFEGYDPNGPRHVHAALAREVTEQAALFAAGNAQQARAA